ncbi:hypothetical protein Amet_2168 [Alkaliphilus metalliredigens QYMF]|uniref:Uncharacterized protein n=1 Tax=Alkaliphilus metalliredigens (strain QYMF) TaxID=293826 RepID=A6TQ59_ALKMQ|nr:hypothetical protein Amet_2168 [Alkaliphilus metalliredigens QYMF]
MKEIWLEMDWLILRISCSNENISLSKGRYKEDHKVMKDDFCFVQESSFLYLYIFILQ